MTLDYNQQHLIKMANQIAGNMPTRENVPAQIVQHMMQFWTPPMRADLKKIAENKAESLSDEVLAALALQD
mgnify:FL=1